MKISPVLLLLLSFNANAITAETCLEIYRSELLLLEVGATTSAKKVEARHTELCLGYYLEDSNMDNVLENIDDEFFELYNRVLGMGL